MKHTKKDGSFLNAAISVNVKHGNSLLSVQSAVRLWRLYV